MYTFLLTAGDSTLTVMRSRAHDEIQRLRGELRRQYIPDVTGQEIVYMQKLLAAKNILPRTTLATEASERKMTVDQLAALVEQKNSEWLLASDQIEAAVYKARVSVENATGVDEIVSALVALAQLEQQ